MIYLEKKKFLATHNKTTLEIELSRGYTDLKKFLKVIVVNYNTYLCNIFRV